MIWEPRQVTLRLRPCFPRLYNGDTNSSSNCSEHQMWDAALADLHLRSRTVLPTVRESGGHSRPPLTDEGSEAHHNTEDPWQEHACFKWKWFSLWGSSYISEDGQTFCGPGTPGHWPVAQKWLISFVCKSIYCKYFCKILQIVYIYTFF